jgi:ribosomal protein RSM22 (predicted rRNA methylase)
MPVTSPILPSRIRAALDARLHGLSQTDAARRAAVISTTYRSGGTSQRIASAEDALAYAVARMPATYAAVAACLNAMLDVRADFAPRTLIDCGAGPGTATFAAAEAFALDRVAMLDANASLRTLALGLSEGDIDYRLGDAARGLAESAPSDLVIASYILNEIPQPKRAGFADALWRATADTLLVIEPGTPDGYQRILALRDRLIGQGAQVLAPCPHDTTCPLTPSDWCHFAQRLPRSRAHRHLKGGELAFEDEKFSYVALTRASIARPRARVLAPPKVTKVAATTKLCTAEGLCFETAGKRDKGAYAAAKKRDWGDAIPK